LRSYSTCEKFTWLGAYTQPVPPYGLLLQGIVPSGLTTAGSVPLGPA
jgi:hypothetical protein